MNIKETAHAFVGDLSVTYSLMQAPESNLWYVRVDADGPAASRSEISGAFPADGRSAHRFFILVSHGEVTPCTLLSLYDDFRFAEEEPLSPYPAAEPPSLCHPADALCVAGKIPEPTVVPS